MTENTKTRIGTATVEGRVYLDLRDLILSMCIAKNDGITMEGFLTGLIKLEEEGEDK